MRHRSGQQSPGAPSPRGQKYIPRAGGGFYIVDEPTAPDRVVTVRRAVHLVINPRTDLPFPELSMQEHVDDYYQSLYGRAYGKDWRGLYEQEWSRPVQYEMEIVPMHPPSQELLEQMRQYTHRVETVEDITDWDNWP